MARNQPFDPSVDYTDKPTPTGRPGCTWCREKTAAVDGPWCVDCKTRYITSSLAAFNAEFRRGQVTRALPRKPGRIYGSRQVAEAMRPAGETVREWAAQMGIDDSPAQLPPDDRPEPPPPSQEPVSQRQQDAPWWTD